MLVTIAIALALLWLLGFSIHLGGALIHLIVLIALIIFIHDLVARRGAL